MDFKDLTTSRKDQKIIIASLPNEPLSCKAEKKVPVKTGTSENSKFEVTQHSNDMAKTEQTSKSVGHNSNNNCTDYQVRLVEIFQNYQFMN